jgi:hypothetical protein
MREKPASQWAPLVVMPLVFVALHLTCLSQYGYFRDELYYLACARRLDWGYVDHPPLSVALLALVTRLFGDSLAVVRAPAVVCGALTVSLCGLLARRLGATGWGVWLACLVPTVAGMYLVVFHMFTINALDILLWALIAHVAWSLLERDSTPGWLLLGVLVGLGLLNKYSVLWLVAGLLVGLLASDRRRLLLTAGPWFALATALAVFSPHLVWQHGHGWPSIEFARTAQELKLLPVAPWDFVAQQAVVMNLAAVPLLAMGVGACLFGAEKGRWRVLGLAFLTVVAILLANGRSRVNYLAPAYPLIIGPGAVAVQRAFERRKWGPGWALGPVAVGGAATMPLALPVLPPATLVQIVEAIPVKPPVEEKGPKSPIQGYADMFGWRELTAAVESAAGRLTPDEREAAVVVTLNYGEAAALEHYRRQGANVPRAISPHNGYWLWGPADWDGRVAVFVNRWPDETARRFESFEQVGTVSAPLAVPEQNGSPVWIARGIREPVSEFWKSVKRFW